MSAPAPSVTITTAAALRFCDRALRNVDQCNLNGADIEEIRQTLQVLAEEIREAVINSPETANFMTAVPIEAAHQRARWGSEHDAGKSPFDWFWLIGYLAQKAAAASVAGDSGKARHHTVSTAAALANWHAALRGDHTQMRPGIDARSYESNSEVKP